VEQHQVTASKTAGDCDQILEVEVTVAVSPRPVVGPVERALEKHNLRVGDLRMASEQLGAAVGAVTDEAQPVLLRNALACLTTTSDLLAG
jgi:hypothetical protein